MKKQLITLLGLLLATAAAFGQTARVKADIPFDFVVRGVSLPAGEYMIGPANSVETAIEVRGEAMTQLALAEHTTAANPPKTTKLVFHRYGNRYFLSQIWAAGNTAGTEIGASPLESELALTDKPENVVVLASLR
jgi:hypothetical protein